MRVFIIGIIILFSSHYDRCHASNLLDNDLISSKCFHTTGYDTDDDCMRFEKKKVFIQEVKIGKSKRSTKLARTPKAPVKKVEKNFPVSGTDNNKAKKKLF